MRWKEHVAIIDYVWLLDTVLQYINTTERRGRAVNTPS
jgi:hypothetical protein